MFQWVRVMQSHLSNVTLDTRIKFRRIFSPGKQSAAVAGEMWQFKIVLHHWDSMCEPLVGSRARMF